MAMKNKKDLNYYLNLPWTYIIQTSQDKKNKTFYIISVD